MNDVHNNQNPSHPIHSRFWRDNPQLWRRGFEGYFATAFDFAHGAVRDYYGALIRETLERYDLDGLELDFLREPYLFSRGRADQGGVVLTRWLGEIRSWVEAWSGRRGHAIRLGVRVPAEPEVGVAMGLDAAAWARQGLVDLVVAAPRWSTIDFDLPMGSWRERLAPCGVAVAGGLEILLGSHPQGPKRPVAAAEARGAAAQVLAAGADAVYLFNYFQHTDPDSVPDRWPESHYGDTLRSLASPERIAAQPRRHAVTYRDVTGPEDAPPPAPPLPACGEDLALHLPTGPTPQAAAVCDLTVELTAPASGTPTAAVNDSGDLELLSEVAAGEGGDQGRRLTYRVPPRCLRPTRANQIRLSGPGGAALRVVALAIGIDPGSPT